jgi:multicomponent Na+:H+ antiporter subunit A
MPLLATASSVAAATLASVPFTIGFFKDEFLFGLALERGAIFVIIVILAAGSTVAYTWRFWSGIFLGKTKQKPVPVPVTLVAPIVFLALVALYGGFDARPFVHLAAGAAAPAAAGSVPLEARYHAEIRPEYLMAAAAFAFGMLLIVFRHRWLPLAQLLLHADLKFGADQAYGRLVRALHAASDGLHQLEVGRLRTGIASVLVPTGLLMIVAVFLSGATAPFRAGAVTVNDVPLIAAFLVTAVSSVALTFTRGHLALAAALSGTGFSLAVIYAFYGAPNVALVAVLIETMLTLLFVGTLALFPRQLLERQILLPLASPRRLGWIAVVVSAVTLPTVWGAISYQPAAELAASWYLKLAPLAHAQNVVSAILADFRGMDTMGEVTVLALVLLGVGALASEVRPGQAGTSGLAPRPAPAARLVTQGIARILYLPGFMVAAALLVKGYADTGDGFSAGIVAALSVLLRYLAFGHEAAMQMPLVRHARSVSFAGLLLALATVFSPLLRGDALLTHLPPPRVAPVHIGSLELITALVFDTGVFLLVLGFAIGVMKNLARIANPSAEPREQP